MASLSLCVCLSVSLSLSLSLSLCVCVSPSLCHSLSFFPPLLSPFSDPLSLQLFILLHLQALVQQWVCLPPHLSKESIATEKVELAGGIYCGYEGDIDAHRGESHTRADREKTSDVMTTLCMGV